MQLHKRLDYGFSGYHVPSIPKAARSARRKGPIQKKGEDDRMHAFDLLASIAGKLLLEGENSPNAANTSDRIGHSVCACDADEKKENDEGVSVKSCPCDQGSSGIISLAPAPGSRDQHKHCSFKEKIGSPHDDCSALAPVITPSKCLEKGRSLEKAVGNDDKSEFSSHPTKLEGFSSGITESCLPKLEEHFKEQVLSQPVNHKEISFGTETDSRNSEDPHLSNSKPTIVLTSDIAKASLDKGHCPHGAFSPCRDNVKVVCRDDDENSSHCNQPSSTMKTTRSTACIGDRRLRKLLSSKYWKVAPKPKDGDLSDTEMQPVYDHRKNGYKRQRSQRIYPFKKRKYFHCSSVPHSDDCKPVYKSPEKATDATASRFGAMEHAANGTSSSVTGQNMSFHSGEPHVKVRIKSIRVPELFIEVPETATIGSLKRTVTEAVTTLLGGGLHVGVLLQGKKIRDDNKTLLQSGICRNNKVDALGFTLDLKPLQAYPAVCSEDHSLLLSSDVSEPLSKCPPAQSIIHHDTSHALNDHPVPSVGNLIESDHDSAPSPTEISTEKSTVDSRALVTVPEGTPEALAVVPAQRKSKPSEMAQRRIRRPFSVSEVEALVQAVERLGTGRWRDVKLRAFDNVKHRTYVDLKDKWKTLVHTARISPQQRRGEPVPQELLDRVLTAHAFWSQQGKQHQLKQQ